MLAGVLQRQGLKARAVPSEAISAAHIVSLGASKAKLVCLSYLGAGASAAHVRYLVRRLRRILPKGASVLVGYWGGEGAAGPLKALKATTEADAYATSFREAVLYCIGAARKETPTGEGETQGGKTKSEKVKGDGVKSDKAEGNEPPARVA
jgi:hypothetical protein